VWGGGGEEAPGRGVSKGLGRFLCWTAADPLLAAAAAEHAPARPANRPPTRLPARPPTCQRDRHVLQLRAWLQVLIPGHVLRNGDGNGELVGVGVEPLGLARLHKLDAVLKVEGRVQLLGRVVKEGGLLGGGGLGGGLGGLLGLAGVDGVGGGEGEGGGGGMGWVGVRRMHA